LVPSISQNPHCLSAAILVYLQSLQNGVLRAFLGACAIAAAATGTLLQPDETLQRLGVHRKIGAAGKQWLMDKAIRIDDDVAEAIFSRNRTVPTYA
jgi:hypothetical protein